jgi:hypothetical protein
VRLALFFLLLTLLALLVETVLARWWGGLLLPDLAVVLVVDLGLGYNRWAAPLVAFAMGCCVDAFSGVAPGSNALLFTLIFMAAWWQGPSTPLVRLLMVFLGVVARDAGALVLAGEARALWVTGAMPARIVVRAAETALLAPVVFALIARLKGPLGLEPRRARPLRARFG